MALGFYSYRKTGSGIQKGGPKKKPFFLFWQIFGEKFWKFFGINMLYVLFCLPIVTFGPATAAMTQVMRKFTIGDPIFVYHEFLDAFKKNFKQSFFVGIFDVVLTVILGLNLIFYYSAILNSSDMTLKLIIGCAVAIGFILLMMHFYIYPQIVALDLKLPQIIKNSFILMVVGFKRSFVAFFVWLVIGGAAVLTFPYSVLVFPFIPFAWLNFVSTFCAYPVIQKFIIDPYYESKGEKNPEYARFETDEEAVFEDMGGFEEPTEIPKEQAERRSSGHVKVKTKGKVIK